MKRSRLTRKTPLQRKTRVRPMSAKKRKEKADTDGLRREFVAEVGHCMECGECELRLDCHEIANGPGRATAVHSRRLQMVLCRKDHERYGSKSEFPVAMQVAKRILYDIRETVAELCDARGDTAVNVEDVIECISQLR